MPRSAERRSKFFRLRSYNPTTRQPRRERKFSRCTLPMLPRPQIASCVIRFKQYLPEEATGRDILEPFRDDTGRVAPTRSDVRDKIRQIPGRPGGGVFGNKREYRNRRSPAAEFGRRETPYRH